MGLAAYSGLCNIAVKFVLDSIGPLHIDDVEITSELIGPTKPGICVSGGSARLSWTPFVTGSYRVEWSQDLQTWTAEAGMPITDTLLSVGDIAGVGKWRFWRASAPAE